VKRRLDPYLCAIGFRQVCPFYAFYFFVIMVLQLILKRPDKFESLQN